MDEMLTNIDSEMRKVSLETRRLEMKMETRVTEDTAESRENVNKVKAEVDALRNKLDTRSDDSGVKEDKSLEDMYDVQQEFSTFKSEVNLSLKKLERDSSKIGEVVEASIIGPQEDLVSGLKEKELFPDLKFPLQYSNQCCVLLIDENHSYQDVIRVLNKVLPNVTPKLATDLTTYVDKFGKSVIQVGQFKDCHKLCLDKD